MTEHHNPEVKREARYTMVYGLSADPVHQMHIDLVINAARKLAMRGLPMMRIVLVPVYRRNPAGKRQKGALVAAYEDRFGMCELAAVEIGRGLGQLEAAIDVSRIDQRLAQFREEPNYTVETLQALQSEESPGGNWLLLLGSDLVSGHHPELQFWRRPEKLVQLATIAIYPRPGYPVNTEFLTGLERQGACFIQLAEVAARKVSAGQIRARLKDGDDPLVLYQEGLLPEPVALFIKERGLYYEYFQRTTPDQ
ncbi:MAG: nicotinate-nicotinamide nucleotide adenylyltransferase [Chloroflexota bacterium]|nr:MAG: nicotinate-nicotinamide nucleotide adenylyltransferase [Chloroflexota bacterium]